MESDSDLSVLKDPVLNHLSILIHTILILELHVTSCHIMSNVTSHVSDIIFKTYLYRLRRYKHNPAEREVMTDSHLWLGINR